MMEDGAALSKKDSGAVSPPYNGVIRFRMLRLIMASLVNHDARDSKDLNATAKRQGISNPKFPC
jgi:hypothetical protein